MTEPTPKEEEARETDTACPLGQDASTAAQTDDELHALYVQQQQRMSCPGCGEGHQIF